MKAATLLPSIVACSFTISIHAAREGGDIKDTAERQKAIAFQSTPPVKAATLYQQRQSQYHKFQSTPPVKAATIVRRFQVAASVISIHAAREGGDGDIVIAFDRYSISIHAAREGGDVCGLSDYIAYMIFQSTPPVKAATNTDFILDHLKDISIHAAREGGDRTFPRGAIAYGISIHAAREGGDRAAGRTAMLFCRISIHAAREGGDAASGRGLAANLISIHAAREGGDLVTLNRVLSISGFQSTPPVKAATFLLQHTIYQYIFQSTPPVKAATL